MADFIAHNDQKRNEYGFNPNEKYSFRAADIESARHWVINHLDCSKNWRIEAVEPADLDSTYLNPALWTMDSNN
jgi:hypothetical protein